MNNTLTIQRTSSVITSFDKPVSVISANTVARWISFIDARPKTIETYTRNIKPFLVFLKDRGIKEPQRADIMTFRDEMAKRRKPATVCAYLAAVRLFFRWTDQECLYPNIADHVKAPKIERGHKKDYLTSKQAARLIEEIETNTERGARDYALTLLMITTGIRTIEVARANVGDLRTVADNTVLYIQGKGRDEKADYVKLTDPVEKAIRKYLKRRGSKSESEPLFTSAANRNGGGRMTTRSISRIIKERLRASGFDSSRLTAHSLRHTAATLNLLNGGTVEETQQLLRHSNINTTMIYSHALERARNASEARITAAIFGE